MTDAPFALVVAAESTGGLVEARRSELGVTLPPDVLEAIAERAAQIVLERLNGSAVSPWLTLADAAAYLGWSRQRLYKRRDVPRYKHGGRVMYRRDALDAFLESHAEPRRG